MREAAERIVLAVTYLASAELSKNMIWVVVVTAADVVVVVEHMMAQTAADRRSSNSLLRLHRWPEPVAEGPRRSSDMAACMVRTAQAKSWHSLRMAVVRTDMFCSFFLRACDRSSELPSTASGAGPAMLHSWTLFLRASSRALDVACQCFHTTLGFVVLGG